MNRAQYWIFYSIKRDDGLEAELDGQSVPVKALSADDAVMLYRRMFPENEGHIKIYKDCIWPNPDRLLREEIINDLPF